MILASNCLADCGSAISLSEYLFYISSFSIFVFCLYLVFLWIFGDELQEHTIVLFGAKERVYGWALFHISKGNWLCAMWKGDTCFLEWICLRQACSVWVLDFMQERFQKTNLGDFESTFIEAENSETKEVFGRRSNRREPRKCSVLAL